MAVLQIYARFIPCLFVLAGPLVQDVLAEQVEASSRFPAPPSDELATSSTNVSMDDTIVDTGGGISKSTITTHTRLSPTPPPKDNRTVNYQGIKRLLGDIFTGYDRRLRPRIDQSRFVFVQSSFVPQKIIDFDTPRNNFTILGYFKMQWRDDFLRWSPGGYDDVTQVRIPARDIWLPDLTISKSQSGTAKVGSNNTDTVVLYSSGFIQWWPEGIYSVICEISIKYFPMDEHVCTLSYFIAGEDTTTLKLVLFDDIITSEISENAEWDIRSVTSGVFVEKSSNMGSFNFTIKRRAGFAMYTILVPAFLISALCCTAFLVPVESGEKGSIAINVFLACLIYVTIITQTVPRNSADMSYFVVYVVILLGLSVLLTFYTIAQSFLYQCCNRNTNRCCAAVINTLCQHKLWHRTDIVAFVVSVVFVAGTMSSLLILLQ